MARLHVYPLVLLMLAAAAQADQTTDRGQGAFSSGLPGPTVPDGLGVNIHFLQPRPGEMEMLAAAGFRWIRMRFQWNRTEPEAGRYDFSAYDQFLAQAERHGIRMLWILDYWNRHYDEGLFPLSDEARAAFARWAAAAAAHFGGRGVLWEMLNEPNGPQWKPRLNVGRYARLAVETGRAIRAAAPGEAFIGPATSQFAFPFHEECYKAGALEYWSAVSVHPYRHAPPETVGDDYVRLRQLIDRYAPGKNIPILSGEWGYSAAWKGIDEAEQAKLLPRQYLINLANRVPISIWYDWHDDGTNPSNPEHHFGTVRYPYSADRQPVYEPKPAYLAAQTLTRQLSRFTFKERLRAGKAEDYVLAFSKDDQIRLAAWSTAAEPHAVLIAGVSGQYQVTGHTGQPLASVRAGDEGLKIGITDAPCYVVRGSETPALRTTSPGRRRFATAPPDWAITPDTPPADLPRTPIARDRYFGICGKDDPTDCPLWQAAGVQWNRSGFSWASAALAPGRYDFTAMDEMVAAAAQSGVQLIGMVCGCPAWATTDGSPFSPPRDLKQWEEFMETLARRYRGRVSVWEIWNEPDLKGFWTGTPEQYGALLKSAYQAAKRGNPECLVMSGGLDGPGERFLRDMAENGALAYCDLIGFHPYGPTPERCESRIHNVWRTLNYYKIRKPIWVTEVGWQVGGAGVVKTEEQRAANLAEMFARLRPLCEVVCWYCGRGTPRAYGIIQGTRKGVLLSPAYLRYRDVAGSGGGLKLDVPARVTVTAGETALVSCPLLNSTKAGLKLQARVHGPAQWIEPAVAATTVGPGFKTEVQLRIHPPAWTPPGEIPCVLTAFSTGGGPAVAQPFTLEVVNRGEACGLALEAQSAAAAGADGRGVRPLLTPERIVAVPGKRMVITLVVANDGPQPETYHLDRSGPAAAWVQDFPSSVTLRSGAASRESLLISVPQETAAGTYPLVVSATCTRHADARARLELGVRVGAPP